MAKFKRIIAAVLAVVITAGFLAVSGGVEAQALAHKVNFKQGWYSGKETDLIIYNAQDSDANDFTPISFNDKEYKTPAYQYIKIVDRYGTYMGFDFNPCNKKGKKKSMLTWGAGSGAGGGQTCWAVITKKSSKKVVLRVYWVSNEDIIRYGAKPECILKDTLKLQSTNPYSY